MKDTRHGKTRQSEREEQALNLRLKGYYSDNPEMLELLEDDTDIIPADYVIIGEDEED